MQRVRRISTLSFSTAATNLWLAMLLSLGGASGLGIYLTATHGGRWIDWLHAAAGFSLALLLAWKQRIILRSIHRRGLGLWALPSILLLGLLIGALATGMLWSTSGLPSLGPYSALTVHAVLAATLVFAVLPHALPRLPRSPVRALGGRRALLQGALLFTAGAAVWRGSEVVSATAGLTGARRRFTGSRDAQSFEGNAFPADSWLLDDPSPLDLDAWRLRLTGALHTPLELRLHDLEPNDEVTATIDCTGGWYSRQNWQGVRLSRLIEQASPGSRAQSIVVHSTTGYWRRFALGDAGNLLLSIAVADDPLTHEHGAPVRLVAPGRRGYDWVKWVSEIELSPLPAWLRWPLPLW